MDINYKIFRKQTSITARPVKESYLADLVKYSLNKFLNTNISTMLGFKI